MLKTVGNKKRIIELDSLRGIAALLVIVYHYTFRFGVKFDTSVVTNQFSFPYGHYGVELFFLISGFVIFMSVKENTSPLLFLKKRSIRLFPTFWISMIFTVVSVYLLDAVEFQVSISDFLVNLTMVPSFFNVKAVDGVYWILKIEWFFYLVIFILLLFKIISKTKLLSLGLVSIIVVLSLLIKVHSYSYYACLFIAGMSFYSVWKKEDNYLNHVLILSLVLVSVLSYDLELVIVTAILVIIMYLMVYNLLSFLVIKPLLFLGKISYALYLIHQNFGYAVQLKLIEMEYSNVFLLVLLPLMLSIFFAWAITEYIELPLSKRLQKYLIRV